MSQRPVCCSKCGRVLTDPYSIAVRMGPECRGGAKLPKPKWKVSGGKVQLVGLSDAADPLAGGLAGKGATMTWMRAGVGKPAHLIRMFGQSYFTTACREVLPREMTVDVKVERIAHANAPGRYFTKPVDEPVCEICLNKAKE